MEAIDALWAPFKAKKKTRAQVAKDHGLEPLATFLAEAAKGAIPVLEALKAKAPMEPIEPIEPIAAEQPAAAAEPIAGEPPAAAEPAAAAEPIAPAEPIAAAAAQFVSQERRSGISRLPPERFSEPFDRNPVHESSYPFPEGREDLCCSTRHKINPSLLPYSSSGGGVNHGSWTRIRAP